MLERYVSKRDGRYVDGFERTFRNTAEMHELTLDSWASRAEKERCSFLNGWVDWADASDHRCGLANARQGTLHPPVLQVRDQQASGARSIDDLGLPGGRPRTMAVDLSGKFLSASREVRILTNVCVYWDRSLPPTAWRTPA
ncbi:MAG: hypothetical protein R2748_10160 [Bryobacterales bacterium]